MCVCLFSHIIHICGCRQLPGCGCVWVNTDAPHMPDIHLKQAVFTCLKHPQGFPSNSLTQNNTGLLHFLFFAFTSVSLQKRLWRPSNRGLLMFLLLAVKILWLAKPFRGSQKCEDVVTAGSGSMIVHNFNVFALLTLILKTLRVIGWSPLGSHLLSEEVNSRSGSVSVQVIVNDLEQYQTSWKRYLKMTL